VQYVALLADGTPEALDRLVAANEPSNIVSVTTASGPSAIVAWDLASGGCNVAAVSDSLAVTQSALAPTCRAPYLHGDAGDAVVAYERSGAIELRTVLATAAPALAVGTPVTFGSGSRPAVWRIGANRWVAWRDASRLHISAVSAVADATIENAPSGPPDAYQPAGPYLFAVWGSELWAITCP
jgi:hypothetical protein